ncbi:MAG: GLUG motif-containing protein, partial [Candidatus Cloacimonetes bacterium]|nr:GLUG motif-containing protein [Candidatus Cloacimonadota bacterium]
MAGSINGWFLGEAFYHPAINNCYVTGTVSGSNFLGGFVGVANCAYIRSSSFSGVVNGGWEAGGFAGAVSNYSQVQNCYSSGTITYGYDVGGFAGQMLNYGSLNNCYSSCQIESGINIGGLVGVTTDEYASATNSYWDIESSGTSSSALGTGRTTVQLKTRSSYPESWDFTSPAAPWWMVIGQMRPILRSEYSQQISTAHQLQLMMLDPTVDYELVNDIDLAGTQDNAEIWGTLPEANGGFIPIGTEASVFTGTLEGNGFTISNLYIKRHNTGQQSFMGKCNTAVVNNLAITNAFVKGETYTGGLSSETSLSSLTNCSYS